MYTITPRSVFFIWMTHYHEITRQFLSLAWEVKTYLTSPGIMTFGNPIFLTWGKVLKRNWFSRRRWAASPTKSFKTTDKHPRLDPDPMDPFPFPDKADDPLVDPLERITRGLYLVVTLRTIQSWSWWKSLSSQVNSLVSNSTLSPILKIQSEWRFWSSNDVTQQQEMFSYTWIAIICEGRYSLGMKGAMILCRQH